MKEQKRINCPVCGKEFWVHALRVHIKQMARMEIYKWYKDRTFSILHEDYINKNTKVIKKEVIQI